jgi:hypothetical protein
MIRDVEMDFLTDMESHEKKRLRSKCSSMQAFRREKKEKCVRKYSRSDEVHIVRGSRIVTFPRWATPQKHAQTRPKIPTSTCATLRGWRRSIWLLQVRVM